MLAFNKKKKCFIINMQIYRKPDISLLIQNREGSSQVLQQPHRDSDVIPTSFSLSAHGRKNVPLLYL